MHEKMININGVEYEVLMYVEKLPIIIYTQAGRLLAVAMSVIVAKIILDLFKDVDYI